MEENKMNDTGSTLMAHCGARKVTRDELKKIPVPEGTKTHQPLSHYAITEVLEEALSFRFLKIVRDEYAVSHDGMKMFGIMDLNMEFSGCRFSIGLRNSNDKSMRLALTAGYRVFVCDNMAFSGDFTPLFHKHTRNLELMDSICIAVDRIQRGFAPLRKQIEGMSVHLMTDNDAKLLIYEAFMEKRIRGVPRALMPVVHEHYFSPKFKAFEPRNLWSLSNAFTSAFKTLAPVRQFEVTARLGAFLNGMREAFRRDGELHLAGNNNAVAFEPLRQLTAGSPGAAVSDLNEEIRKIDGSAISIDGDPIDNNWETIYDDDLADVLSNIEDYFDPDPDDEIMDEFEQKVAA
jgi:hypothetical protein